MKWHETLAVIMLLVTIIMGYRYFKESGEKVRAEIAAIHSKYQAQIDSLNEERTQLRKEFLRNSIIIDSLYSVKDKIVIKYETIIRDYGLDIVSDDSIYSFITDEIRQWERQRSDIHTGAEQSDSTDAR